MVSARFPGSSGPGSSPGSVFLGRALFSPPRCIIGYRRTLQWTGISPGGIEILLVASCNRDRDTCWPGLYASHYADFLSPLRSCLKFSVRKLTLFQHSKCSTLQCHLIQTLSILFLMTISNISKTIKRPCLTTFPNTEQHSTKR